MTNIEGMGKTKSDFPTYNPLEEFKCPMCGAEHYTLTYCKGNTVRWSSAYSRYITDEECSEGIVGRHLHLNCDNCGYISIRKGVQDGGTPNG